MVNPVKAISKAASSFRAVRFKARASGGAPRGIVGRRGKIPTFLALRRLTPRKRLLFSGVRTRENFGGLVNHQAPKPGFCVSKTPGFVQPARRLSAPSFKAIFAFLTQKNGGFLMARARIIPPRNAKKTGTPALIGRLRISVFVHSGTQVGSLTWSLFVRARLRAFRQIPAGNADLHFPLERRAYQADT